MGRNELDEIVKEYATSDEMINELRKVVVRIEGMEYSKADTELRHVD